jgi:hypothetical protein
MFQGALKRAVDAGLISRGMEHLNTA